MSYIFIFNDSRGACEHCIKLGGFADPLYCWYNHMAHFGLTEDTVAYMDGEGVREPSWEHSMYAHARRTEESTPEGDALPQTWLKNATPREWAKELREQATFGGTASTLLGNDLLPALAERLEALGDEWP